MKKIAILAAMKEELNEIKKKLSDIELINYRHLEIYKGKIENNTIFLVLSNIAKVNAAITTTIMIEKYNVDYVINVGSAGSLSKELNILDVVVAEKLIYSDVDVTWLNYEYGQVPFMPKEFNSDKYLLDLIKEININHHKGLIVTQDKFANSKEQLDFIKSKFTNPLAVEMEGASIAHVCSVYNIPFIIIRSISDNLYKQNNHLDFEKYLSLCSKNAANFCFELIKKIN